MLVRTNTASVLSTKDAAAARLAPDLVPLLGAEVAGGLAGMSAHGLWPAMITPATGAELFLVEATN